MTQEWLEGFGEVSEADWRAALDKTLKTENAYGQLTRATLDGIPLEPLYAAHPGAETLRPREAGAPKVRQRIDDPVLERALAHLQADLDGEVSAFSWTGEDSPAKLGGGVPAMDDAALIRFFRGFDLGLMNIRLDAGALAGAEISAWLGLYRTRKIPPQQMNFHPALVLSEQANSSFSGAFDAFKALQAEGYDGKFFAADARRYHGAGASEVQELALMLAELANTLREAERAGLDLAAAMNATLALITADADQWLSTAKIRAAKQLLGAFAHHCALGEINITLEVEIAARMFSRHESMNNLLRSSIALASGMLGGADTVALIALSAACGCPNQDARRLARNLAKIAEDESMLSWVEDPMAGSGAIENLTEELAARAWGLFQRIEAEGGLPAWRESGKLGREILQSHEKRAGLIARRALPLTGISMFPDLTPETVMIEEGSEQKQVSENDQAAFPLRPLSAPFDALRDQAISSNLAARVHLLALGSPAESLSRANFAANLFAAGGISAQQSDEGRDTALVCLTASDAALAEEGAQAAKALSAGGKITLWCAGEPDEETRSVLMAAGVSRFLEEGVRDDKIAILQEAHQIISGQGEQP